MIAGIGARALDACRFIAKDALREENPEAPPAVFRGAAPESARTPYAVATLDGVDEDPEGARVRLGLTFATAEADPEQLDRLTDFAARRLAGDEWRRPDPDPAGEDGAPAHPPLAGSDLEISHRGESIFVVSGARSATERRAALGIEVTFR